METTKCMQKEKTLFEVLSSKSNSLNDDFGINELFSKTVVIVDNDNYVLPEPQTMFVEEPWEIKKLQVLKDQLNNTKNLLNDYNLGEWQLHTNMQNKAGDVLQYVRKYIKPEFTTQAWCKFYEMVHSFPLVPVEDINRHRNSFMSVHLCEAPGAFITSLNHWLKTNYPMIQWNWVATTLNPYFEGNPLSNMIDDDRFIRYTLNHWCFGVDNTGNLMNLKNLDSLIEATKSNYEVLLITADGSIDCIDMPAEQEKVVTHLHFCEIVAMLHMLSKGGSFLLKIFTIFECNSVCLIYLLSCSFNKVAVTKPATSKEGNSETYVVCLGFKGYPYVSRYINILREHYESGFDKAIFCKEHIPQSFQEKIKKCCEYFKNNQCKVILNNIATFGVNENNISIHNVMMEIKHTVAETYMNIYKLTPLSSEYAIIGKALWKNNTNVTVNRKLMNTSYNERCKRKNLSLCDRLFELWNELEKNEKESSSSNVLHFVQKSTPTLWICLGREFDKVYSSRFCEARMLKIKITVDDILKKMNLDFQFPLQEEITKLEREVKNKKKCAVFTFQYTNGHDSYGMISRIYNKINTLKYGESIVFIGYCLLTQLNVGLLYLLGCTFKSIKLKFHNSMGSLITLKFFIKDESTLKQLYEIYDASCKAKQENKTVLSVVHLLHLYESKMFCAVVDHNHWVIKSYVNSIVNTVKSNM